MIPSLLCPTSFIEADPTCTVGSESTLIYKCLNFSAANWPESLCTKQNNSLPISCSFSPHLYCWAECSSVSFLNSPFPESCAFTLSSSFWNATQRTGWGAAPPSNLHLILEESFMIPKCFLLVSYMTRCWEQNKIVRNALVICNIPKCYGRTHGEHLKLAVLQGKNKTATENIPVLSYPCHSLSVSHFDWVE